MDRKEAFRQRLEETFRQEAADHLQSFVACLLALENDAEGDRDRTVETAFREMHSLKGAAAVVGREGVTRLCQVVEGYFAKLQSERAQSSREDLDVLHRAADQLEQMLAKETATSPDDPALKEVMAAVAACGTNARRSTRTATARPEPDGEDTAPERALNIRVGAEKVSGIVWQSEQLVAVRASGEHLAGELTRMRRALFASQVHSSSHDADGGRKVVLELSSDVARLERYAVRHQHRLVRITEDLRDEVRGLSLSPAQAMLEPFAKIVRDLAQQSGKQARLEIIGGETELDRRILDRLRDPLLHLLRNAVAHGIEPPDQRAGKPPVAALRIELSPAGNQQVGLMVSDDGAGIDFDQVGEQAVRRGRISEQQWNAMDEAARREILFMAGVSTQAEANQLAGRGMGLSIVRNGVLGMGGSVAVESRRGEGTRFLIRLPMQMATLRGVLVECAGHSLVVPVSGICRVGRLSAGRLRETAGQPVCDWNGRPLPVARLADLLGLPQSSPAAESIPVLYLGYPVAEAVLCVDGVIAEEEFLLQPVRPPIGRLRWYVGMALNGAGGIVPVLQVAALLGAVLQTGGSGGAAEAPGHQPSRGKRILLAEDTATTRLFLKNLLETRGYEVAAVGNGEQAWQLVQQASCELVLTDVEMPGLDGYELTRRIRGDERLHRLPVVLLTALDSAEHRRLGSKAGADAYLVKNRFDHQQLLATIRRYLHE